MASMLGLIGGVRLKLGFYAPSDGPDEGVVAEMLLRVLDYCVNELNLSVPAWYLPRFTITAQAGVEETMVSQVGDFGRAYMVLTSPSSSSPYDTRVVEMVEPTALYRLYGGGDQSQVTSGASNTAWASACTFTFHDGSHWFQPSPIPISSADYRVLYEPETARPATASEQAFRLPQFDSYIEDMAADRILPFVSMDADKKRDIRTSLQDWIKRGDVQFYRFRKSDRNNDRVTTIPFGQNRWRRGPR